MLEASPIPSDLIRTTADCSGDVMKIYHKNGRIGYKSRRFFLFFGAKSEVIMPEVEKMYSVSEILKSEKFQKEAPPQLKFVIRRVQREAQRRASQPNQTTNRTQKVA